MMAVVPTRCSIKLKSLNTSLIDTRAGKLSHVMASATVTRTDKGYQAKNSFKLSSINCPYKPIFQELPPMSRKSETQSDQQELDKEADRMVERLKRAVDKVVEIEIQKFMGRVKAETLSCEDSLWVDEMRREIGRQYLERPIRYLKSGCNANFEQKIKDVSFLVNTLEELSLT